MNFKIVPVKEDQKSVLRQLIELYEYDFSEYHKEDVNEYGFFGYRYFDYYWTEKNRFPYFIEVDGKLAGFAMVNDFMYVLKCKDAKSMAEFFVMRKYRRQGIGRAAAKAIFDLHPGKWEVLQHGENEPSKIFWKSVIKEYTNDDFQIEKATTEDWDGIGLVFDTSMQ